MQIVRQLGILTFDIHPHLMLTDTSNTEVGPSPQLIILLPVITTTFVTLCFAANAAMASVSAVYEFTYPISSQDLMFGEVREQYGPLPAITESINCFLLVSFFVTVVNLSNTGH
ncbi:hypothetical protein NDAWWUGD_CDS0099 [Salmonella phage SeKF_80]